MDNCGLFAVPGAPVGLCLQVTCVSLAHPVAPPHRPVTTQVLAAGSHGWARTRRRMGKTPSLLTARVGRRGIQARKGR